MVFLWVHFLCHADLLGDPLVSAMRSKRTSATAAHRLLAHCSSGLAQCCCQLGGGSSLKPRNSNSGRDRRPKRVPWSCMGPVRSCASRTVLCRGLVYHSGASAPELQMFTASAKHRLLPTAKWSLGLHPQRATHPLGQFASLDCLA